MKTILKSIILGAIVLLFSSELHAQISYEERVELELSDGYGSESILEFGDKGLMLRSKKATTSNFQEEWKFDMYDTKLRFQKSVKMEINRKFGMKKSFVLNNRFHALFVNKRNEYVLYSIEAGSMTETRVEGEMPKNTFLYNALIMGDNLYVYTRHQKYRYLQIMNWRTGEVKKEKVDVPGFSTVSQSVLRMQSIEDNDEIIIYIKARTTFKAAETFMLRYSASGELKSTVKLTETLDYTITTISASALGDNHYVMSGTYSSGKKATVSEGLFFCELENDNLNYIEYHNFTKLENFFKYLPQRTQDKVERKTKRKKSKGKEITFNYFIADHKIIKLDDGYLFLGEAYYPTYRTEYYTTYTNGQPVTRTRRVFDGYQYTHALLTKFDRYGEIVWDQIFEMWPSYKPYRVTRFISIADGAQQSLDLVFANRGRITSKSFNFDGEILYDRTSEPIQTNYEEDEVKQSFSKISYWYDKYFIAYGTQKIKNKEGDSKGKKRRKVYFFSKIRFD